MTDNSYSDDMDNYPDTLTGMSIFSGGSMNNVFDIIGPAMIGPSSSHTAGAVKIGYVSHKLLGEDLAEVKVLFYGSFLATGMGHGTDKAIVAAKFTEI